MEGSIRIIQQEEKTLVKLQGVLDKELAANLKGIASKTEPPVLLDLKQVPHITVAGSEAILHFYQLHKQKPEIRGGNTDVISLLELTGVSSYSTLVADIAIVDTTNTTKS